MSQSNPNSHMDRQGIEPLGNVLPLTARAAVVERSGKALLAPINAQDVRPLFHAASVSSPANEDAFWAMWDARRLGRQLPRVPLDCEILAIPATAALNEARIRGTDQFRTTYEPLGAQFAMVEVDNLTTPQWWIDEEYVEELIEQLPPANDINGLFDFCFTTGALEAPMLLGTNGAVMRSSRRDLGILSPLRVASSARDKVTFEFDALPRPNWLWLTVIPENGSVLVLNGVHHVAALQRGGRKRAVALIRQGPIQGILNLQDPGIIKPEHLTSLRPALVRDFHNESIADRVCVRAVDQFMRFGLQNPPEIGFLPRAAGKTG